jgi:hypothetical protein
VTDIRATSGAFVVMATLAGAGGHAAPDDGITDTEIRIGVEGEVGSLSLDGENHGFKVAFEEANAGGGVYGRQFVWAARTRRSGSPPTCWPWPVR